MAAHMVVAGTRAFGEMRQKLREPQANSVDHHAWRLQVGTFPVRRLAFGGRTSYEDGTLLIDKKELEARIADSGTIADVAVHLAHPGESCRIVHVLDAVSPMVKVAGSSTVYPGFFGNVRVAGGGRTHVLSRIAVLVCGTFPEPTSGALSPAEATVDMSGPAADCCAFSDTANVVLVCSPTLVPAMPTSTMPCSV